MTGKIVIVGAGPIGLAAAMLLARDGYSVTVLEKDEQGPPVTGLEAWDQWERGGVAQFRDLHIMHARVRHLLDAEFPEVRHQIEASGGRHFNLIQALPQSLTDRSPRQGDDRFETLTARRPILEWAFARVAESTLMSLSSEGAAWMASSPGHRSTGGFLMSPAFARRMGRWSARTW